MSNAPIYCIILAGGASSRFWPRDGDEHPKYLLKPDGKNPLIRRALQRCMALTSTDKVMVITGASQAERVRESLPELPSDNVIVEPARRDTMAAVAFATAIAHNRDADCITVITPADGFMEPEVAFSPALRDALEEGLLDDGRLCSFGIAPTRPETGFGYLEVGDALSEISFNAKRFVEKPDNTTAKAYVKSGSFLWNSGSFAWYANSLLHELERQHPQDHARATAAARGYVDNHDGWREFFEAITKISVDFGLMENASLVGVMKVRAEFDDIGTWDALARYGNKGDAPVALIDSSNCHAHGSANVAFVGCEDLTVAVEGDRILVMRNGKGQDVKQAGSADFKRQG